MRVRATIVEGPLPERGHAGPADTGAGALLVFDGVVRPLEDGRALKALEYEVYEPMAGRQLERLATAVAERHSLLRLDVEHSRGVVPVGRVSLRVVIDAAHRGPALAAMAEFIDLLKRDVPIWKKPVWA
jgi:molybdopterin synthase catalytic subunit